MHLVLTYGHSRPMPHLVEAKSQPHPLVNAHLSVQISLSSEDRLLTLRVVLATSWTEFFCYYSQKSEQGLAPLIIYITLVHIL